MALPTPTTDPFTAHGGGVQLQNGDWVPKDHPLAAQAAPAPAPAPAPTGNPGAAPGTSVPAPTNQALQGPVTAGNQVGQGQQTTVSEAFQQALVNQLAAPPVNADNPQIAPALAANRGAEQRMLEQQRAQLAEQAAARGLDPNAFTTQLSGLTADSAQRQGQFEGRAVQQLGRDRMQQIQSALALAGGLMSDQDRMALQREMAQLQAQLQREGLSLQGSLGSQDIGLRRELGSGQLNLGLLNALLGNQQFGQGLASSNALQTQALNQRALEIILGGGF